MMEYDNCDDDFVEAVSSNFCSRTHRLARIHNVTHRRRQTDATLWHKCDS